MALVHRLLEPYGLVRTEIDRGIGADRLGIAAPSLAICHFEFNSREEMLKGIVPHFQDIEAEATKFTDIKPKYQFSRFITTKATRIAASEVISSLHMIRDRAAAPFGSWQPVGLPEYQSRLEQYGMQASMSRKEVCWDNAPTERFFRTQ